MDIFIALKDHENHDMQNENLNLCDSVYHNQWHYNVLTWKVYMRNS